MDAEPPRGRPLTRPYLFVGGVRHGTLADLPPGTTSWRVPVPVGEPQTRWDPFAEHVYHFVRLVAQGIQGYRLVTVMLWDGLDSPNDGVLLDAMARAMGYPIEEWQ